LSSPDVDSEPRRIAVVCSRYPAVSHAFIVREVRALRERGVEVETFTVRRPGAHELLSAEDREEHARTRALLPPNPLRLAAAHARAALTRPVRYLGALALSLRLSTGGARSALWRLFYFAEGVLLWDECRRRDLRHLHAHFANVGSDVSLLAAHVGGPGWSWSFMMHGCTELFDERPHRLPDKIRRASLVVCNSHFTRAQLMKLVGRDEWEKLQVVPCGIDMRSLARLPHRPPGGPLRILTVGRLVPGKGHAVLLEALASLRHQGIQTLATFVGDGPEREPLERLAEELRLDVRFAGAVGQDELGAYYENAQLFCLPTFAEGLGVVLLEAMGHGLAVVSTRVMGVPEVVDDGETGLLVLPGRADLLADAIARLGAASDLRERMGLAGRRRVVEEFGLERQGASVARLLAGAVSGTQADTADGEAAEPEAAAAAA
jgi:glycosyltransferase involved in cell wall biosynthesis